MELAGQQMHQPQHIYGIDFSGAPDKAQWLKEDEAENLLMIEPGTNIIP